MDIMEMTRRGMLGNQQEDGEQTPVSSLIDLIFPKGGKRNSLFGIDDVNGLLHHAQELPGAILSLFTTKSSAKLQALFHKMFEDIKGRSAELNQQLAAQNAHTGIAPSRGESIGWQQPVSGLGSPVGGHGGAGMGMH